MLIICTEHKLDIVFDAVNPEQCPACALVEENNNLVDQINYIEHQRDEIQNENEILKDRLNP